MKKILSIAVISALSVSSSFAINLQKKIFKSDSSLGKSHGGSRHDIDAYSDGVGGFQTAPQKLDQTCLKR